MFFHWVLSVLLVNDFNCRIVTCLKVFSMLCRSPLSHSDTDTRWGWLVEGEQEVFEARQRQQVRLSFTTEWRIWGRSPGSTSNRPWTASHATESGRVCVFHVVVVKTKGSSISFVTGKSGPKLSILVIVWRCVGHSLHFSGLQSFKASRQHSRRMRHRLIPSKDRTPEFSFLFFHCIWKQTGKKVKIKTQSGLEEQVDLYLVFHEFLFPREMTDI